MDANINAKTIELIIPRKHFEWMVAAARDAAGIGHNEAMGRVINEFKNLANRVRVNYPEWDGSYHSLIAVYDLEWQDDLIVGRRKAEDWTANDVVVAVEEYGPPDSR